MKTLVTTAGPKEFFTRGREIAKLADRKEPIEPETVIAFEDMEDMMRLISKARLALFRTVKAHPGSITEISQRLGRDRSAVKRDVDDLVHAGLLEVTEKPLPGHGRMKEVRVSANRIYLSAMVE